MFKYSIIYTWTPPLRGGIALDERASRKGTCASNVYSWSAPSDSWSSKEMLEELAALLYVLYTNYSIY